MYTQEQFKELQENQKAKADVYKVKLRKRSPQKYYPDLSLEALYSTFSKNKYRGNKSKEGVSYPSDQKSSRIQFTETLKTKLATFWISSSPLSLEMLSATLRS